MNTIVSDLVKGGAEGIFKGIGEAAKGIRAGITGKDVLSGSQVVELEMKLRDLELEALKADKDIALAQAAINAEDAKSGSTFRGGWRPAIGWVCAFALAYNMLLRPIVPWIVSLFNASITAMPGLEMNSLMSLTFALLGLGGFRTFEKMKGIK